LKIEKGGKSAMRINNQDVLFGMAVVKIASECSLTIPVLRGQIEEASETCLSSDEAHIVEVPIALPIGIGVFQGKCPFWMVMKILERYPVFLGTYRKVMERIGISFPDDEKNFITLTLFGLGCLFPSNPNITDVSTDQVPLLFKKLRREPDEFVQESIRIISKINPDWWKTISAIRNDLRLEQSSWNMFVFLLKLLLEETNTLSNLTEEDFEEIEEFLNSRKRGQ